ncbi:MAG: alginate export family protein [Caldimicrobium sp.]
MKKLVFFGLSGLFLFSTASSLFAIDHQVGAHVRFRYENWDNLVTLGTKTASNPFKDRSFFRLRVMLWDDIKFNNQTSLKIRLNTEPKYQMGPYYLVLKDGDRRKFDQDEVVIDNLYLDIKKPFNLPVDLRIGRQDFLGPDTYGEGFLIMDGTPGDGSRTFYFNAIRARFYFCNQDTIDFVVLKQKERDVYLPNLHPAYDDGRGVGYIYHKKRLTASNEFAFFAYGRFKHLIKNLILEPYYIYKKEEKSDTSPYIVPASYLHNVGLRGVYSFTKDLKLRAELVRQFGEYSNDGRDRRAWGGYAFLEKAFPTCPAKPVVEIGYVYLSGDDPNSKKDEAFNPLFSRNPNWNELIIYTFLLENINKSGAIPGYWTNLKMPLIRVKFSPLKNLNMLLSYQKLYADEKTNSSYTFIFSNKGKDRGNLYVAIAKYRFTKSIDGMLQYEIFDPDDFYADEAKTAHFFRAQIQYKY